MKLSGFEWSSINSTTKKTYNCVWSNDVQDWGLSRRFRLFFVFIFYEIVEILLYVGIFYNFHKNGREISMVFARELPTLIPGLFKGISIEIKIMRILIQFQCILLHFRQIYKSMFVSMCCTEVTLTPLCFHCYSHFPSD